MRLSILPVLVAGAGIVSQVSAEPLRVLVASPSNANANIRFGHALANANVNGNDDSDNVARLVRPSLVMTTSTEVKGKHLCGASLKAKALRMSNAFRHALGLPLIEMGDHDAFKGEVASNPGPVTGELHILPIPLFGQPVTPNVPASSSEKENSGEVKELLPDGSVVRIYRHHEAESHHHHHEAGSHHHHKHHDMKHKKAGSFLKRVHRAIMALGLWEGRAVAFVLGCGIGVLLRMFWVMSVLAYRTIRGERPEEVSHGYIMFEHDAENNFVPPPEYTDEKVKVAEVEAQEIETQEIETRME